MKNFFILFLCFGLIGCATMSDITMPNREGLLKLSLGMTKEDVINTMPKDKRTATPFGQIGGGVAVNNPYRSEILQGKDKSFEVLYYVTDIKNDENVIADDELTPLVFDNGKFRWGWSFLQDNVQKYEIRMR